MVNRVPSLDRMRFQKEIYPGAKYSNVATRAGTKGTLRYQQFNTVVELCVAKTHAYLLPLS